jgi:hypothetical protein
MGDGKRPRGRGRDGEMGREKKKMRASRSKEWVVLQNFIRFDLVYSRFNLKKEYTISTLSMNKETAPR